MPGSEGTWTLPLPDGPESTIFEAAERYRAERVPLISSQGGGILLYALRNLGA